jgi:2'-5' RNA ligase
MRLFTAIELPDPVREHLVAVRGELAKLVELGGAISWVKPDNLHVTLKFLGDVPDERVNALCDALGRVTIRPMRLVPSGMVYFPKRGPIRVIAVGLGGDVEQLQRVFSDIENACESLGFGREARAYTPHATLGRARITRRGGGVFGLRNLDVDHRFPGPMFGADAFTLMQSQLHPKGAIYTPAARFPLSGS